MLSKNLIAIFIISIFCASCGKYIDKSTINSHVNDENEISLKFDTTLQNVDFSLPLVQVPIYNFKDHSFLGQLNMQNGNRIILELNMTQIFNEAIATNCPLPNGNPIPHVFDGNERIFCFDTKDKLAKIYVAIENDIAIAGVAIPMKTLETSEVDEPFELFAGFEAGEIKGAIGTYLGTEPGTSGTAIFINFSKWLPLLTQQGIKIPKGVDSLDLFINKLSHVPYKKMQMPHKVTSLTSRQYNLVKRLRRRMK